MNSVVRIGIVEIESLETRWLKTPGDSQEYYLHYMEWPEECDGILVQQLNRRQNENALLVFDPASGESRRLLEESDAAWVDTRTGNRSIPGGLAVFTTL